MQALTNFIHVQIHLKENRKAELISEEIIQRIHHDNCFDFIRYFFAFSLILVHFCTVTGTPQFWFVSGGTRVKAFFIITGFLVVYSFIRRKNLKVYISKRARRILPAYITVILLCTLLGCLLSDLTPIQYFTSGQTYRYLLSNITFQNYLEPCLPGLFTHNLLHPVNGSLWSMKVEVLFYICVPFIVWMMRRTNKLVILVTIFLFSVVYNLFFAYLFQKTGVRFYWLMQHQLGGQMIYFFGGIAILLYFDRFCRYIKWIFPIGVALFLLSKQNIVLHYIEPISFAVIIIGIAYFCKPLNFLKKYDNISYGLYLYHFPVVQVLVHFHVNQYSIPLCFVLTLFITIVLATLSWKIIEKPILNRK